MTTTAARKPGMDLYVVRHAEAVARDIGIADPDRYLTPKGRDVFRKTARNMKQSGASPDIIFTSPLVRAVQTAEILSETLKFGGELVVARGLSEGFDLPALREIVARSAAAREVALVGHDPDMSDLVVSLLSLRGDFGLKKGAAVALRLDPSRPGSRAEFLWMALGKKLVSSRDGLTK